MNVATQFGVEMGRVSRRWRTRLDERLKHMELTQARWIVLLQLSQAGTISQRELAGRISVEGPTLVRVLDRLEAQGLVTRHACEDDRRIKRIQLTDAAAPVLAEINRITAELRRELLDGIPAADLETASRVLGIIGDRLENM